MDRVASMVAVDTMENDTKMASDFMLCLRHARALDVGPRVVSNM